MVVGALAALAARLAWPLLPDVNSGLRRPPLLDSGAPIVPLHDLLLAEPAMAAAMAREKWKPT